MKPRILVARAIFPDVVARLATHFEVESNQDDQVFTAAELQQKLADKDGLLATGSERVTAALIAAAPRLQGGLQHGGRLQQYRCRGGQPRRRPGDQHARRAEPDHRRFRLGAADGGRAPRHRVGALAARRPLEEMELRRLPRRRRPRFDARHHRHGPHRPGHRAPLDRLRHAGALSQPLAPAAGTGGARQSRAIRQQGRGIAPGRPPDAGAAVFASSRTTRSAPPNWR